MVRGHGQGLSQGVGLVPAPPFSADGWLVPLGSPVQALAGFGLAEGAEAPVAAQSSRSVRLGISAGGCVGFHPDREDRLVRVESAAALGQAAKAQRQRLGMTQAEVALVAGVGVRFIGELEAGKPTLQLERAVQVLGALGFQLQLVLP